MLTRRKFVATSALTTTGLLLPWKRAAWGAGAGCGCGSPLPPTPVPTPPAGGSPIYPPAVASLYNAVVSLGNTCPTIRKQIKPFVDALPIPPPFTGKMDGGRKVYDVSMKQFARKLHSGLTKTTPMWGYDGAYPGPTLMTQKGEKISITWRNELPKTHLLASAIDRDVHCGMAGEWRAAPSCRPDVRNVVHVHGGLQCADSDGFPECWITPGESITSHYENDQSPTTLWYHDHTLGITRLNVYTGLVGFYIVHGEGADPGLPSGDKYDVPILIQDRTLCDDGQSYGLFYPTHSKVLPINLGNTSNCPKDVDELTPTRTWTQWIPEFFGDLPVINGMIQPYLEVEPRPYRFRFLNGCNARFLMLYLENAKTASASTPALCQVATDGGLMPAYQNLGAMPSWLDGLLPAGVAIPGNRPSLLLSPAERAEIVIDFSSVAGATFTLKNVAPVPFPGGTCLKNPYLSDQGSFQDGANDYTAWAKETYDAFMAGKMTGADQLDCPNCRATTSSAALTNSLCWDPTQFTDLMQFRVTGTKPAKPVVFDCGGKSSAARPLRQLDAACTANCTDPDASTVPTVACTIDGTKTMVQVVSFTLDEIQNKEGDNQNRRIMVLDHKRWDDPLAAKDKPVLGSKQIWEFYNCTGDVHPMHVHLIDFQVLNRQAFQYTKDTAGKYQLSCTGSPIPPSAEELGWKDTVSAPPSMVTRIYIEWPEAAKYVGEYVWHCHILEHEDNEMMRPFALVCDAADQKNSKYVPASPCDASAAPCVSGQSPCASEEESGGEGRS